MKPAKSWFESLFSNDRREAERSPGPPLLAYYWDGAAPVPHKVRDINLSGMYSFDRSALVSEYVDYDDPDAQ